MTCKLLLFIIITKDQKMYSNIIIKLKITLYYNNYYIMVYYNIIKSRLVDDVNIITV